MSETQDNLYHQSAVKQRYNFICTLNSQYILHSLVFRWIQNLILGHSNLVTRLTLLPYEGEVSLLLCESRRFLFISKYWMISLTFTIIFDLMCRTNTSKFT